MCCGTAGLTESIRRSSSACSSRSSTSRRVEMWCCASTMRTARSASRLISEVPAHCVQILDDMNQSRHLPDELLGRARKVHIVSAQPGAHVFIFTPEQRIQTAEHPQQQQRKFPL